MPARARRLFGTAPSRASGACTDRPPSRSPVEFELCEIGLGHGAVREMHGDGAAHHTRRGDERGSTPRLVAALRAADLRAAT
jgi:hypothetical protein